MEKLVMFVASTEELEMVLDTAECYGAEVLAKHGCTYTVQLACSCEELEAWMDNLALLGIEVDEA